jgi:hypothetical protein
MTKTSLNLNPNTKYENQKQKHSLQNECSNIILFW